MPRAKKNKLKKVEELLSKEPAVESYSAAAVEPGEPASDAAIQVQAVATCVVSSGDDEMTGEESRLAIDDVLKEARAGAR